MNAFIHNLCYYRHREGLSRSELADRIGVTQHTVANYESGRTAPSMEAVLRLSHSLNVTTDQLLGYKLPTRKKSPKKL